MIGSRISDIRVAAAYYSAVARHSGIVMNSELNRRNVRAMRLTMTVLLGLAISLNVAAAAQSPGHGRASSSLSMHSGFVQQAHTDARQAQLAVSDYSGAVEKYSQDVENRCAELHAYRPQVEARVAQLKAELPRASAGEKYAINEELDHLNSWLSAEKNLRTQADQNIQTCMGWLRHQHDLANIAEYNASREEQDLNDERLKMQVAESQTQRDQRMARDQQYWHGADNDDYMGYGRGRRGRGIGRGHGHYSSPPMQSAPAPMRTSHVRGRHR